MTKHNIGMVTSDTSCLVIVILSDEVVIIKFYYYGQVSIKCGVSVGSVNRYLPRGSNENVLSITVTGNVTMSR